VEQKQDFNANAVAAQAQYQQAVANRDQAKVNLERTQIRSPVNGWVTNLLTQLGDYATVGQNEISIVDADSFWVDAYFEETQLAGIRKGAPVSIEVDTYSKATVKGHVDSIAPASGEEFALLPPDNATGNFTKIVQRIPVKIAIDPNDPLRGELRPGMSVTATVDTKVPAPGATLIRPAVAH